MDDSFNNRRRYNWVWAAILVVFTGSVIFIYQMFFKRTVFTGKDKSVAVLPFVNLDSDSSDDYLNDGMTEEIINQLSKITGLRVVARSSVMKYQGHETELNKIADTLH